MKIAMLTRSLVAGGTERQALMLAGELAARGHDCAVITFYASARDPRPAGVRIMELRKRGRWDLTGPGLRLIRALYGFEAEFLYSFLPVPNIVGTLVRRLFPRLKLVFGVRASDMRPIRYDVLSRLSYRAESFFARSADSIIVNSVAGCKQAIDRGMPMERIRMVRNGIDLEVFKPDNRASRRDWGWRCDAFVVGLIARWDPMKDHKTFARALAHAKVRVPRLAALIVGGVPEAARFELQALADGTHIHWIDWTNEIAEIYHAFDCAASARLGEKAARTCSPKRWPPASLASRPTSATIGY